ncbi:MBL fold metallo-hydrolase [Halegenticoccus tardaugens]|uniref:MBL fold metallo-hydrolase n=1 Tax=Halegenticoccus tardaugens TaxID=2071624 RepID=UPI00100AB353|nr:MBL fold metallo-hydrolase [Halegenticoccus tardaugens]
MNATNDWYEIRVLDDGCYAIWELDRYAMYLVEGDEEALLIDAGCGVGDLRGLVDQLINVPVRLFLTHSHWDHIGNAAQFDDVSAHPRECTPDGTIAVDGVSDDLAHRPTQAIVGWEKEQDVTFPDGFTPSEYRILPKRDVQPAYAGDIVDLGNRQLELLALAGHSSGQLGVLDRDRGLLYGADVIGNDRRLLAHFGTACLPEYLGSMQRVRDLHEAGAFGRLVTGHNRPMGKRDLSVLQPMVGGLEAVVNGDVSGDRVDTRYGSAREFAFAEFSIVTRD